MIIGLCPAVAAAAVPVIVAHASVMIGHTCCAVTLSFRVFLCVRYSVLVDHPRIIYIVNCCMVLPETDIYLFRIDVISCRSFYLFYNEFFIQCRAIHCSAHLSVSEIFGIKSGYSCTRADFSVVVGYLVINSPCFCTCEFIHCSRNSVPCSSILFYKYSVFIPLFRTFSLRAVFYLVEHRHGGVICCSRRAKSIRRIDLLPFFICCGRYRRKLHPDRLGVSRFKHVFSRCHNDFVIVHVFIIGYVFFIFRIHRLRGAFVCHHFAVYEPVTTLRFRIRFPEPYVVIRVPCICSDRLFRASRSPVKYECSRIFFRVHDIS